MNSLIRSREGSNYSKTMPTPSHSELDKTLGMFYYSTRYPGIGGKLKERPEDFVVIEISLGNVECLPGVAERLSSGTGDYTWFLLEKRNIDTITALRLVACSVGVSYKKISVAGLKDTKAVTFQLASVEGVPPESFPPQICSKVRIHDAFRMPFKLTAGMLQGNRFEVKVKCVELSYDEVNERVAKIQEELKYVGAPNYYGYQRFGTIRPLTHIIGKLILKGSFKEAVYIFLTKVYPLESPKAKEARTYLESTWDVKGALEAFPNKLHHERTILRYLLKHPNDYSGAIRALPLSVRRLCVEAYQAYLFNLILSRRLGQELPLNQPIKGDLVALKGYETAVIRVRDSNLDKVKELVSRGCAEVVGNVFGYASVLSEDLPGMLEKEVLSEEGISLDEFKVRSMPELSSRGTFRALTLTPEGLRWRLDKYNEQYSVNFSFKLRKGEYATVLLREFVKPVDPAIQGF
ncbi:MAG: tRNA pseudouridine(13) synthase TruD [Thermofilaceae archaeon]|nr:tRNA pseudouridine(13) synthase TruD [Thermofilaceae archaeon]MDW8004517.1 tRNA pseudouridine(13) synthase TruD [Thermofilaceae archaeon]